MSKAITIGGASTPPSATSPHSRQRRSTRNPVSTFPGEGHFTFLIDPHLTFEDMAHHRISHRRSSGLRSRLHDDVAHRDGLKSRDQRWTLAVAAPHYARPGACILPCKGVRRLRERRLDHSRSSTSKPNFQR